MSLIKWDSFNELDDFFNGRLLTPFTRFGGDLAVDVYKEDGNVIAKMIAPGVSASEIDISIEDDLLSISGKREEEKEANKKNYYSKEIRRGSFYRSVSLPSSVDATKAKAKIDDGVLIITMPEMAGARDKAIHLKVSE